MERKSRVFLPSRKVKAAPQAAVQREVKALQQVKKELKQLTQVAVKQKRKENKKPKVKEAIHLGKIHPDLRKPVHSHDDQNDSVSVNISAYITRVSEPFAKGHIIRMIQRGAFFSDEQPAWRGDRRTAINAVMEEAEKTVGIFISYGMMQVILGQPLLAPLSKVVVAFALGISKLRVPTVQGNITISYDTPMPKPTDDQLTNYTNLIKRMPGLYQYVNAGTTPTSSDVTVATHGKGKKMRRRQMRSVVGLFERFCNILPVKVRRPVSIRYAAASGSTGKAGLGQFGPGGATTVPPVSLPLAPGDATDDLIYWSPDFTGPQTQVCGTLNDTLVLYQDFGEHLPSHLNSLWAAVAFNPDDFVWSKDSGDANAPKGLDWIASNPKICHDFPLGSAVPAVTSIKLQVNAYPRPSFWFAIKDAVIPFHGQLIGAGNADDGSFNMTMATARALNVPPESFSKFNKNLVPILKKTYDDHVNLQGGMRGAMRDDPPSTIKVSDIFNNLCAAGMIQAPELLYFIGCTHQAGWAMSYSGEWNLNMSAASRIVKWKSFDLKFVPRLHNWQSQGAILTSVIPQPFATPDGSRLLGPHDADLFNACLDGAHKARNAMSTSKDITYNLNVSKYNTLHKQPEDTCKMYTREGKVDWSGKNMTGEKLEAMARMAVPSNVFWTCPVGEYTTYAHIDQVSRELRPLPGIKGTDVYDTPIPIFFGSEEDLSKGFRIPSVNIRAYGFCMVESYVDCIISKGNGIPMDFSFQPDTVGNNGKNATYVRVIQEINPADDGQKHMHNTMNAVLGASKTLQGLKSGAPLGGIFDEFAHIVKQALPIIETVGGLIL